MARKDKNEYLENLKSIIENNKNLAEKEKEKMQQKLDEYVEQKENRSKILEKRENKKENRGKILENSYHYNFSKAMKAIYITALDSSTLSNNGISIAENMVDNWIKENGGAIHILNNIKNKTYLLNRIYQIVEDAAEDESEEIKKTGSDNKNDNKKEEKNTTSNNKEDKDLDDSKNNDVEDDEDFDDIEDELGDESGDVKDSDNDESEIDANDADDSKKSKDDSKNNDVEDDEDFDDIEDELGDESGDIKDSDDGEDDDKPNPDDLDVSDDTEEEDEVAPEGSTKTKLNDNSVTKEEQDEDSKAADDLIDEVPEEDITLDGETTNDGKVFDELEKEDDVKKAIALIRQRVADAEETFIKRNAEDKKQIDDLLSRISDNVKTIEKIEDKAEKENIDDAEKKIAQESVQIYKRKITNITENRPLTIFEKMARNISNAIVKESHMRDQYIRENGSLNVTSIMEVTRVIYGFLETINTLQIDKVDSKYITNILNELMK